MTVPLMTEVFVIHEGPFGSKFRGMAAAAGLGLAAMGGGAACGGQGGNENMPSQEELQKLPTFQADSARSVATAKMAAELWGGDGIDLNGWKLQWMSGDWDCGTFHNAGGCTLFDSHVIQAVYDSTNDCPEVSSLAHEVGHIILGGDNDHKDPRWQDPAFGKKVWTAFRAVEPDDGRCAMALVDKVRLGETMMPGPMP
jgi:hypothetical protein